MTEVQDHAPEGNSAIIGVYTILSLSVIFLFTPIVPVFVTGTFLLPVALFIAWLLRFNKSEDSLVYNHMIYISRTIWMFSVIMTVTTAIAGVVIINYADNSPYTNMINDMMNGIRYSTPQAFDVLIQYIKVNLMLMIVAGLFCLLPTLGYIAYRLIHGFSRALKGYRLAKPKSWL